MGHEFVAGGETLEVSGVLRDGWFILEFGGTQHVVALEATADDGSWKGHYALVREGQSRDMWIAVDGDRVFIHAEGRHFEVEWVDGLARLRAEARSEKAGGGLLAPMPGVVVELRVAVGDPVSAGDVVAVIESMKLQTSIVAEADGRVDALPFGVGQTFEQGAMLVHLEAASSEEAS